MRREVVGTGTEPSPLTVGERRATEAEPASLPLPEVEEIVVRWEE